MTNRPIRRAGIAAVGIIAVTASVAGCGTSSGSANNGTIVVGGKNFTEQLIMSNILALLIQHDTNLKVVMKDNLDSNVAWNAMKNKDVDVYVEYTGTGLVNILKDPVTTDPQKAYDEVKQQFESKYHITWLQPIGFNDTYAMVMQKSEASKLGITDISQLAQHSNQLVLGADQDFLTRNDALPAMNKLYGTHFKAEKPLENGLKYEALVDGKVDVVDGFSTDPEIPEYHLVVLKDDKHLFPPYYAAPIIQDSTLKAHPELKGILDKLAGKIDDAQMQKLNDEVDMQKKTPQAVAKSWLTSEGLI